MSLTKKAAKRLAGKPVSMIALAQAAFEREAEEHRITKEAHSRSLERGAALERELEELRAMFGATERHVVELERQLSRARQKNVRLAELRQRAEARSLRHQFIDILNLEGFQREYERFARELTRGHYELGTVVYFDLDGFKAVNDLLGHHLGNEVLIAIGVAVQKELRPEDVAACLHGDEFALVLPGTDRAGAEVVVERIIDAVHALVVPSIDTESARAALKRPYFVSFSAGYCVVRRAAQVLSVGDALRAAESEIPKFADQRKRIGKYVGGQFRHYLDDQI